MSNKCESCAHIHDCDEHGISGCPNLLCESQLLDKCPYCGMISFLMGDGDVLFECRNRHIWSYHYGCEQSNQRCSGQPGEFIGWAIHDQTESSDSDNPGTTDSTEDIDNPDSAEDIDNPDSAENIDNPDSAENTDSTDSSDNQDSTDSAENTNSTDSSDNQDSTDNQNTKNRNEDLIKEVENHRLFVRVPPHDINYQDGSRFVWKCQVCGQKYINSMCG